MASMSRMLAAWLGLAGLALPTLAQVAPPPPGKPEPAETFTPPAPPPVRPRPTRPVAAPDVDFEPIARRDESNRIIRITEPVEYVAMSHNPLIDVPSLVRIAPHLYARRLEVESHVIEHLDALEAIENGIIESARTADEDGLREVTGRVTVLTDSPELKPFLTSQLVADGVLPPQVAALTQKIAQGYQQELSADVMGTQPNDGTSAIDRMMHVVLRMSLSEHEYFYRRLMLDAADQFNAILPELGLDGSVKAAISPLADRLASESDLDARAALIREIFALMPEEQRKQALRMTVERRPDVDASALMPPLPEGVTPAELDNETRHEIIFQLLDGGKVNTASLGK